MTDDPRIDPADLRNVRFPGSSRRYDARSVDQFLETVAARIAATNVLVDDLRAQLAAAQAAPAPAPAPVSSDLSLLDDDELVRLVGEETATVLATARRAAEEIRSKAEESAARMIREATTEADRAAEEARTRAAELTATAEEALERATREAAEVAAQIRAEATEEVERLREEQRAAAEQQEAALAARRAEAESEAEQILADAREEGRGMVAEAKEVRARILDDLQRRRDIARDHIERLLAGRERLLAAYGHVRENLDEITAQLADSLPDAPEPELPDGFVGIVGASTADADADADGSDAEEPDDTVAAADEPDDTVAPAEAPEVQDDTVTDDEHPDEARPDAEATAEPDGADPADGATPEDPLGPVPADLAIDGDVAGGDRPLEVVPEEAPEAPADQADRHEAVDEPVPPASGATDDDPVPPVVVEEDPPVEQAADVVAAPDDLDEPVEALAGDDEPAAGDVDALFARLRAEREESVARAQEVLGAGSGTDDVGEPEPAAAPTGDVDRVPPEFLADEADLDRRREALEPLEAKLNRDLKRRLADEQNELLDLLRRSTTTDPAQLLPELDAQVGSYASVAVGHLGAASAAGGGEADVAELADALGRTIVEPFRRRVERAAADVDDADGLDERLRALYREWKAQHIGPAAEDALLSAYASGTLAAAADGASVSWRIDPAQGPCPDAQDNALAGAVAAGEAFPTGDRCPQAHPGCRCLLVLG